MRTKSKKEFDEKDAEKDKKIYVKKKKTITRNAIKIRN